MQQIATMNNTVINLSDNHSLISNWVSELRDVTIQNDRLRFRRNLERIAEGIALEISKEMPFEIVDVQTPLGIHQSKRLKEQPVLATILRAGLGMHGGLINYFDKGDNAFVSAYRRHFEDGSFEISLEYVSCPSLEDRIVIICDPMLATGASLVKTIEHLKVLGNPKQIHFVCAIACSKGIELMNEHAPDVKIWCGDIDTDISEKGYILPGLGDAGDLAYGTKQQQ